MKTVNFLSESEMNDNLAIIKKKQDELNKLWKLCDEDKYDCDEVAFLQDKYKEESSKFLSMFSVISKMDEIVDRAEDDQYDVTKIKISNSLYKKMKDYDLKVLKIILGDIYTEEKLLKDVSFLHFMSGFSIDEDLKDDLIHLPSDVLRKKS